jgi:hypothetical protein
MTAALALRAAATAKLWAASSSGEFMGAYRTEAEARAAAGKSGKVYRPDGTPVASNRRHTPRRVAQPGELTWHRRREAEGWAAHYESADGRWRIMPIGYTVPCDGYVDGHIGCHGNTEHDHEAWQLEELRGGEWMEDDELYPRLRDAKAVANRLAAR